jgi:flavin-binding protein dodecin
VTDHVYKTVEVTGSSTTGVDDAIRTAVGRASQSLRNLEWFEVTQVRGHVVGNGEIGHFQVTLKTGFRLE